MVGGDRPWLNLHTPLKRKEGAIGADAHPRQSRRRRSGGNKFPLVLHSEGAEQARLVLGRPGRRALSPTPICEQIARGRPWLLPRRSAAINRVESTVSMLSQPALPSGDLAVVGGPGTTVRRSWKGPNWPTCLRRTPDDHLLRWSDATAPCTEFPTQPRRLLLRVRTRAAAAAREVIGRR
jgi:hypothetical protein